MNILRHKEGFHMNTKSRITRQVDKFWGFADVCGSCGIDRVAEIDRPASEDTDRGSRMDGQANDLIIGIVESGRGR